MTKSRIILWIALIAQLAAVAWLIYGAYFCHDPSASIAYMYGYLFYSVLTSFAALVIVLYLRFIEEYKWTDLLIAFFCTPIPFLAFLVFI